MMSNVYDIIKAERRKRGMSSMYWSKEMARLAQSQANYCAKVGHMVHSNRFAFQGGENLCGGRGSFSPRTVVNAWLRSKAGHREYLLSPRVTKSGVGIARRNGKMFVAWAFSSDPPAYPDCPYYRGSGGRGVAKFNFPRIRLRLGGRSMLRTPVSILIGLCGLWGVVLGAHGLYVYFSRLEFLFGAEVSKLFMTWSIPGRLGGTVLWMSSKALQSWFIPAVTFVGGWAVMSWSGLWDKVSGLLSKSKLW